MDKTNFIFTSETTVDIEAPYDVYICKMKAKNLSVDS